MIEVNQLETIAKKIRYLAVKLSYIGKAAHLGSSLSCVDLITAAYWSFLNIDPNNPNHRSRDRFILSKGHAITSLYAALAEKSFFSKDLLNTFNQDGGKLPEHPSPKSVPGVEMATGSLGHGLSVGVGQALAGKILNETYKTLVLLSDGECNEGSVWEAALFAPKHKLNNLIVMIDFNKWQATGKSCDVMQLEPLKEKWESFGWKALDIDGNNMSGIIQAFNNIAHDKPTAIIAHTVKGKGISFMGNDNNWHYRIPNEEEVLSAKGELNIL